MRLRLQGLQESNSEAQKLWSQGLWESYKEIDGVLYHQGLPFVLKAIQTEFISQYHNNPLAGHFGIEKICKLLARKYY